MLVPVAQASRRLSPVLAASIYGSLERLKLRFMPVLGKLEEAGGLDALRHADAAQQEATDEEQ